MRMESTYNRRNIPRQSKAEGAVTGSGKSGIRYIPQGHEDYPGRLSVHRGMPKGLYVLGGLPEERRHTVGIVGARRSSSYGNETARIFARELTRAGVQIISGLAWGIDGMAHMGALEAGGSTYAVLGCGADVCYPKGHQRLYEQIQERGGILSEYSPGMPPKPGYFPARNRIISGLSDLVLVVEARERSGALITADFALEQGKDVFAVPGRVGDPMSRGCLNLLKQGAGVADSPDTLLEALETGVCRTVGLEFPKAREEEKSGSSLKIILAKEEEFVYSWIRLQSVTLDELVMRTGLPAAKVVSALVGLELKGCIREIQKNHYVRTDLRVTNG